jgi:outer membrane protein assembly factor BamB
MRKSQLFVLVFLILIPFSAHADWPQFQKDCKHTGADVDGSINLPLCIKQMYPVSRSFYSEAGIGLIDNAGGMYFNEGSVVRKLDLTTGQFIWKTNTGVVTVAAPGIIYNNTVIFEYSNGFVCLDSATGNLLWQKPVAGMSGIFNYDSGTFGNFSMPSQANGHIYCGSSNGEIAVVNASTGDTEHLFKIAAMAILSAPAVDDDGSIYFGSADTLFYCVNGSTGAVKWHYATGTAFLASASIDASGVYCSNALGKIYKFNKSNGAILWTNRCTSFVNGSGALYGDSYYLGSDDRCLYRFNKDTGAIIWSTYLEDNFANMSCIVIGGKVFISGCIDQLCVVDSSTGSQIFSCLTLGSNFSNLSYWNRNIIFTSVDGNLYIVGQCDPSCGACSCDASKQTRTLTWTITPTITATPTVTQTLTATLSSTCTPSITPTFTPTCTFTMTVTATVTSTATPTPSFTPTATDTCTATVTSTFTTTFTPTITPTVTSTSTLLPTATITMTALPCDGVTKPSFTISVNYAQNSSSNLEIDIESSSILPVPPSIIVCAGSSMSASSVRADDMRAQCHSASCLTFTASPAADDGKTFILMYPESNPGNFETITARGTDYCGITGQSDGTFTSKTPSNNNITVFKNVINPDNGEKTTLVCNMPADGAFTAKVYSRTGALVKTICSGVIKSKGSCSISWNGTTDSGTKASSGIYEIIVSTPSYTEIVKTCVLR